MLKTRFTELVGIDYPIMQGGMQWLSTAEFAAAVSNAGALGTITALTFKSKAELQDEIRKTKDLTDKPFAVNVSMLPIPGIDDMFRGFFEAVCAEGVKVVETSGRNPEPFVPMLKDAGVKIIHKVPAVRYALKAQAVGVDAVTIVGFECGGHPGNDDVTTMILIPKAAAELEIPALSGGGHSDGRSLAAALCLGAEGVVVGTRFMASAESPMHDNFKNWMLNASELDTMIVERSIRNPARVIINDAAKQVLELEEKGATLQELFPLISGKVGKAAYLSGDIDAGVIACGQVVGRINDIPPLAEIIKRFGEEAEQILKAACDKIN